MLIGIILFQGLEDKAENIKFTLEQQTNGVFGGTVEGGGRIHSHQN